MSNFRKTIGKTFQFEQDQVKVIVSPMKRKDAIKLVPHMARDDQTGEIKLQIEDQMKILDLGSDILPSCVKNFEGLTDADGNQIQFSEAVNEFYFLNLIGQILEFVMQVSRSTDEDEKKSDEPSENTTITSAVTTALNSGG